MAAHEPPPSQDSEHWQVKPGSVYDGEEMKIRFCGIDAPEKQQKHGIMARDKLRSFLQSGKVTVNPVDVDRYGRVVAEVWDEDGLVQSHMATAGAAFPYEQYKEDCPNWDAVSYSAEMAKEKRLGVWADAVPEYPWEWRRENRSHYVCICDKS